MNVLASRLRHRLPHLVAVAASLFLTTCRLDELLAPTELGVLTVSESVLLDSARIGSTAPRTRTVQLGIEGASSSIGFRVSAELGSDWITQGLGAATAPADLTIAFSPAGLQVGEYRDTLRIVNDGPDARVIRVPVQFTILPCATTDLGALPVQRADELTNADCASTAATDRFSKRYRLSASTNDSLTLRVAAANFTPRITLRRTGAMTPLVLAESCDAAGSGACTGYVTIPEDGDYEIEVSSANTGATGNLTLFVAAPRAPEVPTVLAQRPVTDLTASIAPGGSVATDRIAVQATLADADLDSLVLEIEKRPVGTAFSNVATQQSPRGRGPAFTQTVTGLLDNTTYRWQVRAVDVTGRASAWVAFNGGNAAYSVGIPEAPTVPTALVQRRSDNVTAIPLGGTTNEPIVRLGATVSDPDPDDQVRLELEVRPLGTPFTNVATQSSAPQAPGAALTVSVAGLQDNVQYRWQARAVDQSGRTSPWAPFAGSGAHFRTALPPAGLAFSTQPASVAAGSAITPAVRVAVQDALGNTLQSFTGPVTIALNGGSGATLAGTRTVSAVAGVATFTDLSVDRVGNGYTLTATAGTLAATSAAFAVTASAAQAMSIGGVPSSVVAGAPIAPAITVTVRDGLGNVATGFNGSVSLALAPNSESATLLGATTVAATNGIASFDAVRVERAATALTIVASATGIASATSSTFAVVAAAADTLRVVTAPSAAAQSGAPFAQQPVLQVEDAFGNIVRSAGRTVTATIASGPAGSSLTGATATTDASGLATFATLAIVGPSGNYTLGFASEGLQAEPTTAISIGAGAAAQLAILTSPPDTAINGSVFATAPVVRVLDAAGNAVAQSDVSITVSLASGSGALFGTTSVLTNSAGEATFSDLGITGTVGARTLAFSASGLSGVTSDAITLLAGPATTLELASGNGQTAAAASAVSVAPAVRATDASGNAVAGVPVTFAVTAGGGSITPTAAVSTGADGIASLTTWTLGPSAGTNTLSASATDLDGSPVTFTATGTAGAASLLSKTGGDNLSGLVATTLATPHEVQVTDATGNPVAGVTITWTALGGGSVSAATSVTDADGRATTTRTLGPTAGAQSTRASATLAGGLTSVTFDITATVGGATQLTLLSGDAQVDTVGATLPQPLRVLVRDALNNPVEGVLITWSVLAGGGITTPTTSLTDATGIAETSWRLGTTRTATDSTQIVRASGVASPVTFLALARAGTVNPDSTRVSLSASTITASRSSPVTVSVTARDGFGNPVAGVPVVIAATGSGNTIVQPATVTGATGAASGSIGATAAGARTVTVTAGGVTASTAPTLTVIAAAPSALFFSTAPTAVTAGADLAPAPAVGALDEFGNQNLTFSGSITLSLGTNPAGGTLSGTLTRTAVNGVASFPGIGIDRAGAGYTLRATNGAVSSAESAPFSVAAGALAIARSSLSVSPASIVAGTGSATITVTARDANDNPIAGLPVTLGATGSGNTLTQPAALTDANGVATGTLAATITGTRTVSATIDGTPMTTTVDVTVVPGAVSPTLSTITGIPSTLVAGVEASAVTVTVRDALGNVVPDAAVVIAATGTGNTVTQPSGPTNASGVAVGGFASTRAELKTLSATANGVALANTAVVTVNPGVVSASSSLLSAAPDSVVAGEGTSIITVTARDANDNVISGAAVVLAATGAGNSLVQPTAPTAANGTATGTLSSTVVGDKTVTATVNGIAIAASAVLRVVVGGVSPSQSIVTVDDASLTAGDSSAVTVTVRDASDNPIPGVTVTLALSGNGNTVRQPLGPTDAAGIARGNVGSTVAESKTLSATADGIALTQTVALTVSPAAVDAAASDVSVAPTTLAADGSSATITVTARDRFGNAVPAVAVVLGATGSGNTLVQPSSVTNASGIATGSISSTNAEAKRLGATADGVALADTVTLTVAPAALSATQSTVSASPTTLTAGTATSTITVVARDANGNVIPGLAVTLAATGSGNTVTQPAAVTDTNGIATGSIASTRAGTKTVTATIGETAVTQTATVTVGPASIASDSSSVVVSAGTISAGVGSTSITVTVRDAFGNPIPGVSVVLSATGAGNTLTQPAGVTDAAGAATGTFTSTVSEAKTISATAGGIALTQTAAVSVVPDAASATTSLVQAAATSLIAGVDTTTITVTARDANGNPVPGVSVTLEGSAPDLRLVQPASVTDATGRTTGRVSGTLVGARSVTALLNGVAAQQTVALTITPAPASVDSSLVVIAPATLVAGAPAVDVTVTARDPFGNPVPGATVALSASAGDVTVTQPAAVTDANGLATGRITATLVGAKVISATVNGAAVTQSDTITVTPAAVSATTTTVAAVPTTIVAGSGTSIVTVTARDQFSNVVPGATVVLSASGDDNRTLTQPSGTTNASGVATGSIAATTSGPRVVSASVNGTAITQTATVTVTPAAPSATASTLGADAASIVAGGTGTTITVVVRDQFSNPVPNVAVVLASSGSGNTIIQPGLTDATGTAAGTLTSTVAEVKSVSATAGGTALSAGLSLTVTPGAASGSTSTVAVAPGTITASDGTTTGAVTVTARDANGNVIPGATVVLAATGTGNAITQPSVTGANGVATGAISSTGAGSKTISATINGVPVTQTAALTVAPAAISAATSTLGLAPSTIVAGGAASTATVTVRDQFGNAIPGVTVALAAPGTGVPVMQPAAVTDASGVATGSIAATTTGTFTVSATAGGIGITQTQALTVTPGAVSGTLSTVSASAASIVAGTGSSTITVTARDANGNVIPGAAVTLSATGTANAFAPAAAGTTNAAGQFVADYSSTAAGARTISASIGGTAVSSPVIVTVTAGAISAARSLVTSSLSTLEAGADTATISITVRDANDNPISGAAVTFTATGTGNTVINPSAVTNASGLTTGRFTSTGAGAKTIAVTAGGVALSTQPALTVQASRVSESLSTIAATPTSVVAGTTDSSAVTVTARDIYGNAIAGAAVTLSVAGGTGNTLRQPSATDASGVAVGYLRSTSAGTKTVSARIRDTLVTGTAAVTVTPAGVSAGGSTVTVSSATISAGTGSTTITATVVDAFGNPISGAAVNFTASGTGNTVTQPTGGTNAAGVATGTLSSTVSGLKTVTASAAGVTLTQQPVVTVVADVVSGTRSGLRTSATALTASSGSSSATLTVTARDANGNPVPGASVVFSTVDPGVVFVQPSGTTNAAGEVTGSLSATQTGAKTIRASLNGVVIDSSVVVTVAPAAASPATTTITAASNAITTDQTTTLTVQLRDAFGNALTTSTGTVVLATTVGTVGSLTPGAGGTFTATYASTATGTASVTGTLNGTPITDGESIVVSAGAASTAASTVTPAATQFTAGGSTVVTVQMRDQYGNPRSTGGNNVEITTTFGTISTTTNNGNGTYSATLSSTATGTATVSARLSNVAFTNSATVTIVPAAVSAGTSSLIATSGSIVAGGAGTTITATVRDQFGNVIPNAAVTFALTGTGSLSASSATTNASGVATTTLTSTTSGSVTVTASAAGTAITQQAAVTVTAGAASQLAIVQQPNSATAGASIAPAITVRALDANSNLVTTFTGTVVLAIEAGTGTAGALLTGGASLSVSAVGGVATFSNASINLAGTGYRLRATSTGLTAVLSNTFNITPASAAALAFTTQPSATSAAGAVFAQLPAVTVRDAFGNTVTGYSTAVTVALTAGSTGTLSGTASVVPVNGVATFSGLSINLAGSKGLQATSGGLSSATSSAFTIVATAISDTASRLSVASGTITAGGAGTSVTATVRDRFGNPRSGVSVAFTAPGGTLTPASATTNASGVATSTLTATTAGSVTVSARAADTLITQTQAVTVNTAVASAATSTISATPGSITTDQSATVTVTLFDAFNNRINTGSATVTMSAVGGTVGTVSNVGNGTYTATFTSGTIGTATISATVDGVTMTNTAQVVVSVGAASPAQTQITASPTSITTDGTSLVTVQLRDAAGNNLSSTAGSTVTLSSTVATLSAPVAGTGGTFTATLDPVTTGTATITGTLNGVAITDNAVVTVDVGAPSAALSTVVASASSIEASVGTSTITVTVRDASNAPIPGATVTLSATGTGGNIFVQPAVTNASGVATGTFRSTVTGAKTISAAVGAVTITQTASVTVTPTQVSPSLSTVTALPASITASSGASTSTVTVTVRDTLNNLVPGAAVNLTSTGLANVFGDSTLTANASGVATTTIHSTSAGTKQVSATAGGIVLASPASVTVTPAAISAAQSLVTVSPASVAAGVSSTVTVTARDAFSNPVPNATVTFTATGTGNTLTQPAAVTSATGVATGSLSSTAAGAKVITAVAGGVTLSTTPTLTVTAGAFAPGASSLAVSAGTLAASSGTSTITVTATVRDANSNPISGATVTFAATGTGNTFGAANAVTDASGVASTTFASTVAQSKTLSASVGGTGITETQAVTVTPAAVSLTNSLIAATPSSIVAGSGSATVSVTVRDAFGNTIPGEAVVLSSTGTGNTFTAASGSSDASGVYSTTFSSTVAESKTISATINAAALTPTAAVTVTVGAVSAAQSTAVAQQSQITANITGTPSATILVTARDASGNAISGATVSVSASGSNNVISTPAATDASGQTSVTFYSRTSGTRTFTVVIGGVTISAAPQVTVVAAPASADSTQITAAPTAITTDQTSTISVQARDAFGNALGVSGGIVTLSSTVGGALTVTDNANGTYSATLSPATTGTATITGTIGGVAIADDATVTITPGSASLATSTFTAGSSSLTAGQTTPLTVTLRDAESNPLTASGGTVTVEFEGTPRGSLSTVTNNGDGTYAVTYTASTAGSALVRARLNGSLLTAQVSLSVTAGTASVGTSTFTIDSTQITASAGTVTTSGVVTVRDASSNPVAGASVSFSSSGTDNVFTPASGSTDASGQLAVTFSSSRAEAKTLSATISGVGAITQQPTLTVTPGAPAVVAFTTQPSASSEAGVAFAQQPVIEVRDANANRVTTFSGTVTMTLSTGTGTLLGTTALAASAGIATFTNLAVDSAGTGKVLQAAIAGPITATSSAFSITAGAATDLATLAVPTSVTTDVDFTPSPSVRARDTLGNTATSFVGAVTVEVVGEPGTLTGTLTRSAVAGVVTFDGLRYTGLSPSITLRFTSAPLTAATTAAIPVTP